MTTVFLFCAALGGGLLVLQLLASVVGLDHHGAHGGHVGDAAGEGHGGLDLFSVRSLATGVAAFGLAGIGARALGLPTWAASGAGLVVALAAMVGVATLMRSLLRLESDGTVRISGAIGQPAVVYLRVPGAEAGAGKVQLTLQNRVVELEAVTRQAAQLPTGADVIVVDVLGPGLVEVVPTPSLEE